MSGCWAKNWSEGGFTELNAMWVHEQNKSILAKWLPVMNSLADLSGIRGAVHYDEPMADHTSWRTGGPAACFFIPADAEDLATFLRGLPRDEPVTWVGLGSNLLVRDGGYRGTVVMTTGVLGELEQMERNIIHAGAGVACAKVARFSAELGLAGAEFLAGIPGTLGGALAMNAGAFGGETWDLVRQVETMDRSGQKRRRSPSDFEVAYRSVSLRTGEPEWFLAAELRLEDADSDSVRERIRLLLAERADHQPTGVFSCGSVFRNPANDYAGRLIEICGLKGRRVGHARISEKHANFIINEGDACADDIEDLILLAKKTVLERCSVELEPEVRIIGERGHGPSGAGI